MPRVYYVYNDLSCMIYDMQEMMRKNRPWQDITHMVIKKCSWLETAAQGKRFSFVDQNKTAKRFGYKNTQSNQQNERLEKSDYRVIWEE